MTSTFDFYNIGASKYAMVALGKSWGDTPWNTQFSTIIQSSSELGKLMVQQYVDVRLFGIKMRMLKLKC